MELFTFISEKFDISLRLHKVLCELEHLDKSWVMRNVPLNEHHYGRIPGEKEIRIWSIPRSTMKLITMLALIHRSKIIVDVGTSAGYSALWLSVAARINKGNVYTIEIFKPKIELALKYVEKAGMQEYVNLLMGDAAEVLKNWRYGKIDFILFDADKQNHLKYLKLVEPHLNKDALVVVDNGMNFRNLMADLKNFLDKSENYTYIDHDYENGIIIAMRRKYHAERNNISL